MRRFLAIGLLAVMFVGVVATAAQAKYISRPRPSPVCGNAMCELGESHSSCPSDCR